MPLNLNNQGIESGQLFIYTHYGVTGNFKSLNSFVYQVTELLVKWLNRRSQRKSYNREGFKELIKQFEIAKPHIYHAL